MNNIAERYIKQIDSLLTDLKKLSLVRENYSRLDTPLYDDDSEAPQVHQLYTILKETGKPLHSKEITEIAKNKRLLNTNGRTPEGGCGGNSASPEPKAKPRRPARLSAEATGQSDWIFSRIFAKVSSSEVV